MLMQAWERVKVDAAILAAGLFLGAAAGTAATAAWVHRHSRKIQAIESRPLPALPTATGGVILQRVPGPVPPKASRVVRLDLEATRPIQAGEHFRATVTAQETDQGTRQDAEAPQDGPVKVAGGLDTVGPMPAGSEGLRVSSQAILGYWNPSEGGGLAYQRTWGPWVAQVAWTAFPVRGRGQSVTVGVGVTF